MLAKSDLDPEGCFDEGPMIFIAAYLDFINIIFKDRLKI